MTIITTLVDKVMNDFHKEMNNFYKDLSIRYWGYFFFLKLDEESSFELPPEIRKVLIDIAIEDEIKCIFDQTPEQLKNYLMYNQCGAIIHYSDRDLLTYLVPGEAFDLTSEQLELFHSQVKEYFTPIEYIKNSQNHQVLQEMEYDGAISPELVLEIFGVEL